MLPGPPPALGRVSRGTPPRHLEPLLKKTRDRMAKPHTERCRNPRCQTTSGNCPSVVFRFLVAPPFPVCPPFLNLGDLCLSRSRARLTPESLPCLLWPASHLSCRLERVSPAVSPCHFTVLASSLCCFHEVLENGMFWSSQGLRRRLLPLVPKPFPPFPAHSALAVLPPALSIRAGLSVPQHLEGPEGPGGPAASLSDPGTHLPRSLCGRSQLCGQTSRSRWPTAGLCISQPSSFPHLLPRGHHAGNLATVSGFTLAACVLGPLVTWLC